MDHAEFVVPSSGIEILLLLDLLERVRYVLGKLSCFPQDPFTHEPIFSHYFPIAPAVRAHATQRNRLQCSRELIPSNESTFTVLTTLPVTLPNFIGN